MAADTWTINSCSDSVSGSLATKTGTLRFAAQNAASGDTIDLSQLPTTCSTITLQAGAVVFAQDTLTLLGSAATPVEITGKYCPPASSSCSRENARVITHTGSGTLEIYGLTISKGYLSPASGAAIGGCISSQGNVILDHSEVKYCTAQSGSSLAIGGGIYTVGTQSLVSSQVTGNSAYVTSGNALGGGLFAKGTVDIRYSKIQNNRAKATTGGPAGVGGGIVANSSFYLLGSTISGNQADRNMGGVENATSNPATAVATIKNSTISGNSAGSLVGGILTYAHSVKLDNSTIVFNTAAIDRTGSSPNFHYYAPGISLVTDGTNVAVTMQSTLIANNTAGSTEYDLSTDESGASTISFSGSNNLVRATFASVPTGTIKLACPLLGPLRDNGGPTFTHALLSHSPGIDQGNNIVGLADDQRGAPFNRVDNGVADIGAYEVQHLDIVFNTSFETCPILF